MIRVIQFAGCVNHHDFIDVIVQHANRQDFAMGVCTGTNQSNIARPVYSDKVDQWVIGPWSARRNLLPAAFRLARLLKRWKADILHTHHFDEALIGYVATRLCRRTQLIVGRHYSDSLYRIPSRIKRSGLMRLEQVANHGASRIIVPSTFIASLLADRQRVAAQKIQVVPYGFSRHKYPTLSSAEVREQRRALGIEGHFTVGLFGRVDGQKGHDVLLKAVANLRRGNPTLKALIVGDGPELPTMRSLASDLGLESAVHFLGWRADAIALMATVDAVVQPTLQEAFSQVMVEALWMGKPLVITDVSGATDIISNRQNGMLIPKNDPNALAEVIEELLTDQVMCRRLGEAGRAYVEQNLTAEKIVPRYEQVYRDALAV